MSLIAKPSCCCCKRGVCLSSALSLLIALLLLLVAAAPAVLLAVQLCAVKSGISVDADILQVACEMQKEPSFIQHQEQLVH